MSLFMVVSSRLSSAEQIARIRLIRSENVGPITFRHLLARFSNAIAALAALPDLAGKGGARAIRIATSAEAERELAAAEALGAHVLFLGAPPYPPLLAAIEDAPPVLFTLGHLVLLDRPCVALVGARNASAAGLGFASKLARDLSGQGVVVVSGLARGVDTAVHKASLERGTIAVVAGGLDVVYPPENRGLYDAIAAQGLIVAEQPLGTQPQARHFPRRNRIISGLSLGVVVLEAALKSGSLITARQAGEQGREVMAVPGSPLDPRAQGANALIREGATLVQSAHDVMEAIMPLIQRGSSETDVPFAASPPLIDVAEGDRKIIADLLSPTPVQTDEIIRLCGLSPALVQTILLELELAGRLVRHAGNRVSWA